ncbi:MAG: universal stress protein [Bifidobacterium sp.]|nr:universal stress protein [Bifidobacterium sp.]
MNDAMSTLNPQGDIVVGVDGSTESFGALRWALRQAALSGQTVNAVYGWSYSWDMGPEPQTDGEVARLRAKIAGRLRDWVDEATKDIDIDNEHIKLTSFRASGTAALLEIGANAQQSVVGRRSMIRVARWLVGSLSSSVAEDAEVPVTVIRTAGDEDINVQDQIANALTPADTEVHYETPSSPVPRAGRPVVVGVDGSAPSKRALEFAGRLASLNHAPLHVMFCWTLRDLGTIPGYETTVAPMDVAQEHALGIVRDLIADTQLPAGLDVVPDAFHISAGKGLVAASCYARHLVVGSRGLNGLDAHFLGSVSRQVLNLAECNLTIVH